MSPPFGVPQSDMAASPWSFPAGATIQRNGGPFAGIMLPRGEGFGTGAAPPHSATDTDYSSNTMITMSTMNTMNNTNNLNNMNNMNNMNNTNNLNSSSDVLGSPLQPMAFQHRSEIDYARGGAVSGLSAAAMDYDAMAPPSLPQKQQQQPTHHYAQSGNVSPFSKQNLNTTETVPFCYPANQNTGLDIDAQYQSPSKLKNSRSGSCETPALLFAPNSGKINCNNLNGNMNIIDSDNTLTDSKCAIPPVPAPTASFWKFFKSSEIVTVTVESITAKKFSVSVNYEIVLSANGIPLLRKYKDFNRLYKILTDIYTFRLVPPLPVRRSKSSKDYLQSFCQDLRRFLIAICIHPVLSADPNVFQFFNQELSQPFYLIPPVKSGDSPSANDFDINNLSEIIVKTVSVLPNTLKLLDVFIDSFSSHSMFLINASAEEEKLCDSMNHLANENIFCCSLSPLCQNCAYTSFCLSEYSKNYKSRALTIKSEFQENYNGVRNALLLYVDMAHELQKKVKEFVAEEKSLVSKIDANEKKIAALFSQMELLGFRSGQSDRPQTAGADAVNEIGGNTLDQNILSTGDSVLERKLRKIYADIDTERSVNKIHLMKLKHIRCVIYQEISYYHNNSLDFFRTLTVHASDSQQIFMSLSNMWLEIIRNLERRFEFQN